MASLPDLTTPGRNLDLPPPSEGRSRRGGRASTQALELALSRMTDGQLAWLISLGLFVLAAWPLALVAVPPFQDLPNHLAAATILERLKEHPEFVFNGFFKTNSALFAWLSVVGPVRGIKAAARWF